MIFYLGAHHAHWLGLLDVPLFVSRRTLSGRHTFPRAMGSWALDSGGFTELSMHGRWTIGAREYASEVRRFRDEIGGLAWAAPQDWMCEAEMLKRTKLTIADHIRLTVENFVELRSIAPDLPIVPVLQGWTSGDYYDCAEAYERAGVDLCAEPLVGLGTVCRRQNTTSAALLVSGFVAAGLKIHGFGFKATGLKTCGKLLTSADSMAWSYHARREPPLDECRGKHKNCANCPIFALMWREAMLASMERSDGQLQLAGVA
ncbi:MAG: hypothetical protein HOW73_43290 [Polyangiaceae bacterium]|nr:hypothetical protein [Polyangiaceae bacterium]